MSEIENLSAPYTARQTEILTLLAQGRTNKQIAAELGISNFTVRDHVSSLLRLCGATNRTELAYRCSQTSPLSSGNHPLHASDCPET